MEIEKALLEEAQYAVSNLKNRARALEPQLQEIERLKLEIEAECHAARLAPKRLLECRFKIDTEYQCPHCDQLRTPICASPGRLRERRSRSHALPNCAAEFVIPTR